jgi:hypothetical protein
MTNARIGASPLIFILHRRGHFRGQSEVAVEAIKEYLDRNEPELEKSENPCDPCEALAQFPKSFRLVDSNDRDVIFLP